MATYDNLPVYKTSYDLLVNLFRCAKEFQRDYKYTLGESIKKETIAMMMNVYRANSTVDKLPHIKQAREHTEVIRLLLRVCRDLRQVNIQTFADLNVRIESVSKQLTAWQNSMQRKIDE